MTFRQGESGNPSGRPPGVGQVAELKRLLLSRAPEVIEAVINKAVNGDVGDMKLIIDRMIPALKPTDARVNIPVPNSSNPGDQAGVVVDYLLAGAVPVNIATQILQALVAQQQISTLIDLERRILALEGKDGNGND